MTKWILGCQSSFSFNVTVSSTYQTSEAGSCVFVCVHLLTCTAGFIEMIYKLLKKVKESSKGFVFFCSYMTNDFRIYLEIDK